MTTDRLRLEPYAAQYAPAILDYYSRNRAHLERWEPERPPEFYTLAYHLRECERAESAARNDEFVRFAAFARDGDALIALVNLWNVRRGVIQAAVMGYSVDEAHCGNGYATEASAAAVGFAFDVLGLHRVETSYHPLNERSGCVLRKLGFTVEGYARDYLYMNGRWNDAILVSKINPEWRAS